MSIRGCFAPPLFWQELGSTKVNWTLALHIFFHPVVDSAVSNWTDMNKYVCLGLKLSAVVLTVCICNIMQLSWQPVIVLTVCNCIDSLQLSLHTAQANQVHLPSLINRAQVKQADIPSLINPPQANQANLLAWSIWRCLIVQVAARSKSGRRLIDQDTDSWEVYLPDTIWHLPGTIWHLLDTIWHLLI